MSKGKIHAAVPLLESLMPGILWSAVRRHATANWFIRGHVPWLGERFIVMPPGLHCWQLGIDYAERGEGCWIARAEATWTWSQNYSPILAVAAALDARVKILQAHTEQMATWVLVSKQGTVELPAPPGEDPERPYDGPVWDGDQS